MKTLIIIHAAAVPQVGSLLAGGTIIHVCVDHPDQLSPIIARAAETGGIEAWSVVIMVDCGMHRDGVSSDPDDTLGISLADMVNRAAGVSLFGCYTHGGQSYTTAGEEAVRAVGEAERDAVVCVAKKIEKCVGMTLSSVGVGSTPTASHPPLHLAGVTEMHPGNYIF